MSHPVHRHLRFAEMYEAGDSWLAGCSPHPDLVRQAWILEALAPIATGEKWLAVEVAFVATVRAMKRIGTPQLGPVLADPGLDLTWWLIPPDTADELVGIKQAIVQPKGEPLHCPPTGWYQCGRKWLHRPDGSGTLNDPTLLAAALGPGNGYKLPAEAYR
ncbi:hypothetical protein PV416_40880 [Streptomyces ipomoeae]|jgi:hypothetical protein|uniref:Uncharacterized protein n=1 Tax=Streptomyces ipomoeae 91-03 TaxID=698759 RepID=L1L8T5_9ACTN|nr:hypothetical protein [Streptomyces ipomoeae]EKX69209.1 hypothetical protein STRIP9103_05016 [Streptomyces ipomoeae 91-03]MDX2699681.1 hypothetical protein [Streptomyces ipomoeae]MDX2827246.1 hypothetical protein [Streptomyces ipomoeae]MDX2845376.1 hypothetical protein [Streptomyces ipomoeae]MDX2875216.1 hypothetical protein [Streptomyces ipomoeae]